jgi:ATP-dependent DNA helicase RecG
MRAGETLTEMSEDRLKAIFAESQADSSAELCPGAGIADLAPEALEDFRCKWIAKTGNPKLAQVTLEQLLADAELTSDGLLTYAALILFGRRSSLTKWLANAELIFEYRSNEASISHQQRQEFRQGFFLHYDELWNLINLRNDLQHYQEGLFMWDIPTFNERVVREAILNAVCHRDYRTSGSIFVRQFPRKLQVVSPGGWPEGVTTETVLYRQKPRNRRLAEALSRCGLVERAGQGYDEIFTLCVKESKPLPDFTHTDDHQVSVTLNGIVQDPAFLRFLSKVGDERQRSFSVEDFLVLDLLRREQPVPDQLTPRLPALRDAGVVELLSRGRGTRYILSKKFYDFSGKRGSYTRKRGLDRETNKELIVQHLKHHRQGTILEFEEVLPALTRYQIHSLLKELRRETRVAYVGPKKGGHWEQR